MNPRQLLLDAIDHIEDVEDIFLQLELQDLLDDATALKADAELALNEVEEDIKGERGEPQYDKEEE